MIWTTALIVLALIWLIALIDSLRRANFPALFGSERAGKYVWRLSFLLCNPLLAVLYLLLVPRRLLAKQPLPRDLIVALSLLLLVSVHLDVWGQESDQRFTLRPGDELPGGSFVALSLRTSGLQQSSSMTSYFAPNGHPVPQRTIQIRSVTQHPVLTMAARRLAQRLVNLSFVDEVTYLPAGAVPEPGSQAPDMYVMLDANLGSWALPFYGRAHGAVSAQLNNTPLLQVGDTVRAPKGVAAACLLTGAMDLDYNRYGLALGVAAYDELANGIAGWFGDAVEKQLQAAHDKHGTLPPLPESFKFRATPKLANLGAPNESAFGWFLHNRSLWLLDDARPAEEVADELALQLGKDRWVAARRSGTGDDTQVVLKRGDERLKIHRQPEVEPESFDMSMQLQGVLDEHGKLTLEQAVSEQPVPKQPVHDGPIVVAYENPHSDAEVGAFADKVFATENANPHLLLLLLDRAKGEQRAACRAAIRASVDVARGKFVGSGAALSAENWFRLAKHAHDDGVMHEAVQATENAWLLCRLGLAGKPDEEPIAELAAELEVVFPAVTRERIESLGFTALERDVDTTVPCMVGESRVFVCVKDGQAMTFQVQLVSADDDTVVITRRFAKVGQSSRWTEAMETDDQGAFGSRSARVIQGLTVDVRGRVLDDKNVQFTLRRRQ